MKIRETRAAQASLLDGSGYSYHSPEVAGSVEIETRYEPTVSEVRETCARNASAAKRLWWFNAAIGILGGAGLLILGIVVAPGSAIAALQVVIGLLLVIFGAWHLMLVRSGTKLAADRNAARLCVPTALRITDDRYQFELPTEKGEVLWELTHIVVSSQAWTFALNRKISLIVPKRALSAEEEADFAAFIEGRDRKLVKTV